MSSTISTVYLYNNSSSKILLSPATPSLAAVPQHFTHHSLSGQVKADGPTGAITFKLNGTPWGTNLIPNQPGVEARLAALDLIRSLDVNGYRLLCCADLSRIGHFCAGCLIVSNRNGNPSLASATNDFACISFHGRDTIRVISMPENGAAPKCGSTFEAALHRACVPFHGFHKLTSRVNCPDYQITSGSPWIANGVNTVYARLLVLEVFQHMAASGWTECIPIKVCSKDTDLSTLIFRKRKGQQNHRRVPVEMMCISLHMVSAIRLIGNLTDGGLTASTLADTIRKAWKRGLVSVSKYGESDQYLLDGTPWKARTAVETINARRLICRVFESMHRLGWKIYAALDLSKKTTDKSSFFFIREVEQSRETVGCISLTGANKVQLMDFPPKLVDHMMHLFQSGTMGPLREDPVRYNPATASFKLKGEPWENNRSSVEIANASYWIQTILQATVDGGGRLLCTADLSANTITVSGGSNNKTYSADLDSFFFSFS